MLCKILKFFLGKQELFFGFKRIIVNNTDSFGTGNFLENVGMDKKW